MAVLAAAASLTVLVPLYRARRAERRMAEHEVSVYRDQLDEIDRDRERGVIRGDEAEAARTEIARRLIRAGSAEDGKDANAAGEAPRRIAALAAVIAMPVLALGLYLLVGSPTIPDAPLAARLAAPPDQQDMAVLIARVEAHLAGNPDDAQGWQVLAPVYVRLGRNDDAVRAYSNLVRLLGSNADTEGDLGEAIVRANQGMVTAEAHAAFERAAKADPSAVRPRFYLALGLAQEGNTVEAANQMRALIAGAPPDAPWVAVVNDMLARLEAAPSPGGRTSTASAGLPGPSAGDVAAASSLSSEDRSAMIEGMVGKLAESLKSEPDNAEGWARLVRSYMVLGRPDDARAALGQARSALAGKTDKLALVETRGDAAGLTQ